MVEVAYVDLAGAPESSPWILETLVPEKSPGARIGKKSWWHCRGHEMGPIFLGGRIKLDANVGHF